MLDSIIENKIVDIPWPIFIDGNLYQGEKLQSFEKCHDQCLLGDGSSDTHVCEHGLSYISRKISGRLVTIAGVYIPSNHNSKRNRKNVSLMQRKVSIESVRLWFSSLDEKANAIDNLVSKTAKANFDQFHEFVKWAREIGFYSERLLAKNATSGSCAFDNASDDLKSLYKISVMLLDSLDTTALYFNPESAKFGRKKYTDIYSMVHKIKLVLSHASKSKNKADVVLRGRVKNNYNIYESFKIVPLSLIQNAIKYRRTGDVEVVFDETDNGLCMTVNSIGFEIPESEIIHLFERGFRATKAREMSVEGSGLGLYVLKIVTDAHNFDVRVSSTPTLPANKKLARNSFSVFIR
ncbi:ATP-binding protein [Vibrio parahaemolyticus]|uniref:ATP-binding protein n=1 Tax=Vibrio parahaemolyticus TaxID=670 RepID=UPI00236139AB|nr:ATP-binding protein [Vibrio parahaemolyticus]